MSNYVPPGASPPPRQGRPWWVWLLGGCAGCGVIVLIAVVVLFVSIGNFAKDVAKEVNPTAIQQKLGPDVPLYPGATLNTPATTGFMSAMRILEKAMGREAGSVFRALAVLQAKDEPDKVLRFYENHLLKAGWKRQQGRRGRQYGKGSEVTIVEANPHEVGTLITLMRGSREMASQGVPVPK